MSPDQLFVFGIHFPNVLIVRLGANIDGGDITLDHFDEAGRDVAALAFGLKDHAAAMRGA